MSSYTEKLIVSPILKPGNKSPAWSLERDFSYYTNVGITRDSITFDIPKGFTTDFASVPRPFWCIFPKWGSYGHAAVVHDYLYSRRELERKTCDLIFLEAMGVSRVPWVTRSALYYTVRLFGWMRYKKIRC